MRHKKAYTGDPRSLLWTRLERCRKTTEALVENLEAEDLTVQPIADVSPIKWHLAHTTWFFEELLLAPHLQAYKRFDETYHQLFNSYYKALGPHWSQGDRGSLSRPTVKDILSFRAHVNRGLADLLSHRIPDSSLTSLLELGIQHEQQHQELILMDVKYILSRNPSLPAFAALALPRGKKPNSDYREFAEGIYEIGAEGEAFHFDNEKSRHKVYLYPFAIAEALVTNEEYQAFIEDGGYQRPELWLSLGWDWVKENAIAAPLYWSSGKEYTLHGSKSRDPLHPVSHISYFEADAYAKWKGQRLAREAELEVYLSQKPMRNPEPLYHPCDPNAAHYSLWAWTQSSYAPYPGFQEFSGPAREYNGKFMCNQYVLRGGSLATPDRHYRPTYRNFFLPQQRWMFSGIRLAKDYP